MIPEQPELDPKPTTSSNPIGTMEGEGGGVVTTPESTAKEAATQHSTVVPNEGELEHRNAPTATNDK